MMESKRTLFLASAPEVPEWFMQSEVMALERRRPTYGYGSSFDWKGWQYDRAEFHFYRIVAWRNAFADRMVASEHQGNPAPQFMQDRQT